MRISKLMWIAVCLCVPALTLSGADASGAVWQVVYETDFSSDPGWVANNSDRYYWNSSDETYSATQVNINGGGEYGYYDAGYNGGSFRLEWDVNMLSNDYASDVSFGLYDSDMSIRSGSLAHVGFTLCDQGHVVFMDVYDADNAEYYGWSPQQQFSHDTWYHVVMQYDADAGTLTSDITVRDTGEEFNSLSISGIGSFASDMGRVGTGHVRPDGNYQVPGAESSAKFDNIVFSELVPEPPQEYYLPVLGQDVPLGGYRAEQGITSGENRWFTSSGSGAANREFSSFDNNWQPRNVDVDATISIEGKDYEVWHIGDIAYVSPPTSASYVYAPIKGHVPFEEVREMIGLYRASDFENVDAWYVPGNTALAGLEYHESDRYGNNLYGVPYVDRPDSDSTSILVFDERKLREESSFGGSELSITTKYANGIAFIEGSDDFLYVSVGRQGSGEAWIEVFDLEELWGASGPVSPFKNRKYSYDVPWFPGHGEGLTFKGGELWVAKGSYVAHLKTEGILPKSKGRSVGASGSWGAQTSWDEMVPDASTVVTVSASILEVDGSAQALDTIIENGGAVVLQSQGTMTLGDTWTSAMVLTQSKAAAYRRGTCLSAKTVTALSKSRIRLPKSLCPRPSFSESMVPCLRLLGVPFT